MPLCGLARAMMCRRGVLCLLDGCGGVHIAGAGRLHKTYKTYKTYKMMMGAPVFALTGYAVASHVIPRGFAVPLGGVARVLICRRVMQWADLPQGKTQKIRRRDSKSQPPYPRANL